VRAVAGEGSEPGRSRDPGSYDLSDEDNLRSAYRAHGPELYRFARRLLGDGRLAEEAVQETFVKAWRRAHRFDPSKASLRTWLFAIARNTSVDMARARATRPGVASDEVDDAPMIADPLEERLRSWQIEEAIRRLSDDHRRAVVEVHLRGRSYEEAGIDLGIPAGTVKSRVFYGVRALRGILDEMGWSDDG
jgi:RNA polymerase sigma-70 factor, ECF subfamily